MTPARQPARTGAGDLARALALLWRHELPAPPARRGPRPVLDLDGVVAAAVALADEAGVEAVTMRALADRLGVAPMTLYTHVPGRAELLDCVVDDLYVRLDRPGPDAPGWRAATTAHARTEWGLHLAHPWLIDVATTRPVLGPGTTTAYEHGLRALAGAGLDDVGRDAALALVLGHVRTCARLRHEQHLATRAAGEDDAAWWARAAPLLAERVSPERFPLATRVGAAAGAAHGAAYGADHLFAWGLDRVLDGIERLTAGSGSSAPRRGWHDGSGA